MDWTILSKTHRSVLRYVCVHALCNCEIRQTILLSFLDIPNHSAPTSRKQLFRSIPPFFRKERPSREARSWKRQKEKPSLVQQMLNVLDFVQQMLYFPHLFCVGRKATLRDKLNTAGGENGLKREVAQHGLTPLEARFASAQQRLNTSRKQLLRAILENPDDTFFLSSRELTNRYE